MSWKSPFELSLLFVGSQPAEITPTAGLQGPWTGRPRRWCSEAFSSPVSEVEGPELDIELDYPRWVPQVTGPMVPVTGYLSWFIPGPISFCLANQDTPTSTQTLLYLANADLDTSDGRSSPWSIEVFFLSPLSRAGSSAQASLVASHVRPMGCAASASSARFPRGESAIRFSKVLPSDAPAPVRPVARALVSSDQPRVNAAWLWFLHIPPKIP